MVFFSPSRGAMDIDEVFADLLEYASKHPEDQYSLIIGTDSQIKESKKEICYVTALIVHQKGKGARFYYTREYDQIIRSLRQRIFMKHLAA